MESTRPISDTITGSVIIVSAVAYMFVPLNHDVSWFLYGAGRVLDGAVLYRDIVEINPPLGFYLFVPIVAAARMLAISEVVALKCVLLLATVISLLIARSTIERALAEYPVALRGLLMIVLAAMLVPLNDIGQREHLMLILSLPYMLHALLRSNGDEYPTSRGLLIGVAAGIGFALKPFFLIAWIAIEIIVASRRGPKSLSSVENFAIASVLVVYLAVVFTITPEYLTLVQSLGGIYRSYQTDPLAMFLTRRVVVWYVTLIMVAILVRRVSRDRTMTVFFAIGTSLMIAAFVQLTGWGYHFYPADVFNRLLLVMLVWSALSSSDSRRGSMSRRSAIALMLVVPAFLALEQVRFDRPQANRSLTLLPAVRADKERQPMMVFSTSIASAFPLVLYAERPWASRYNCLWPLPGLYEVGDDRIGGEARYHARASMIEVEAAFVDSLAVDLERNRPGIMVVDRHRLQQGFTRLTFDVERYLNGIPRIKQLLREYDSVDQIDSMLILRRRNSS